MEDIIIKCKQSKLMVENTYLISDPKRLSEKQYERYCELISYAIQDITNNNTFKLLNLYLKPNDNDLVVAYVKKFCSLFKYNDSGKFDNISEVFKQNIQQVSLNFMPEHFFGNFFKRSFKYIDFAEVIKPLLEDNKNYFGMSRLADILTDYAISISDIPYINDRYCDYLYRFYTYPQNFSLQNILDECNYEFEGFVSTKLIDSSSRKISDLSKLYKLSYVITKNAINEFLSFGKISLMTMRQTIFLPDEQKYYLTRLFDLINYEMDNPVYRKNLEQYYKYILKEGFGNGKFYNLKVYSGKVQSYANIGRLVCSIITNPEEFNNSKLKDGLSIYSQEVLTKYCDYLHNNRNYPELEETCKY